jgi:hypothetical protein
MALFLVLLMSSQMLPITQIGQMLSTNQWVSKCLTMLQIAVKLSAA